MKDDKRLELKLKQFYSSSQNYMERLDRHDEQTFGSYLETCKKAIPLGASVLDCGCGTGFSSHLLAAEGFRVTAIDMSSLFISEACKRYHAQPDLHFLIGDVSSMPFCSNSVNSVCSFDLLEHVTDVKGTLKEMCRTVKPGGSVIIFMPNHLDPVQHLIQCIRWKKVDNRKPWEARSRINAFYRFVRSILLVVLKALNINRKIYYIEPVLQDDANICGADFDATWLTNRYDVEYVLKNLGVSIKYISFYEFDDKIIRIMQKSRIPRAIQLSYTKLRTRYAIVGVKK